MIQDGRRMENGGEPGCKSSISHKVINRSTVHTMRAIGWSSSRTKRKFGARLGSILMYDQTRKFDLVGGYLGSIHDLSLTSVSHPMTALK